jgi:hypothetical protein
MYCAVARQGVSATGTTTLATGRIGPGRSGLSVPGLTGFSVQSQRGKTVPELAKAGRFPHKQISVTTVQSLHAAGKLVGYDVEVVRSPGIGYHSTVTTPMPLPDPLAIALSAVFTQMPNPFPGP